MGFLEEERRTLIKELIALIQLKRRSLHLLIEIKETNDLAKKIYVANKAEHKLSKNFIGKTLLLEWKKHSKLQS